LNYTFNNDRNYEVSLESQLNPSGSPNTLTKQLITRSVRLTYSKLVYSFSLLSFLSLPPHPNENRTSNYVTHWRL